MPAQSFSFTGWAYISHPGTPGSADYMVAGGAIPYSGLATSLQITDLVAKCNYPAQFLLMDTAQTDYESPYFRSLIGPGQDIELSNLEHGPVLTLQDGFFGSYLVYWKQYGGQWLPNVFPSPWDPNGYILTIWLSGTIS